MPLFCSRKKKDPSVVFPENLLAKDLLALNESNGRITALVTQFRQNPPTRREAFDIALELELSAGESHYQEFLDSPSESATANIFKQLNQEDRDHAERIRSYMTESGIRN